MAEARLDVATTEELDRYKQIWRGGYFGGDPLDPIGAREYGDMSLISVNHALYQAYVRPFIKPDTRVLEIGPGRGAWTRTMVGAKEIWCADALSAEHNMFWEYVGRQHADKIHYHQVSDFSLDFVPDDYFDFIFSFGAFCHITAEGQKAYHESLFKKAKPGAKAVIMIADFDKFNESYDNLHHLRAIQPTLQGLYYSLKFNVGHILNRLKGRVHMDKADKSVTPGRFYHLGVKASCEHLEALGWRVILPDVGLNHRDAVLFFEKPRQAAS